jgi:hypothetical protein
MAKDQRMEALKTTAEEAVEETREQARGAMDSYFDFLHKTVSSCPSVRREARYRIAASV